MERMNKKSQKAVKFPTTVRNIYHFQWKMFSLTRPFASPPPLFRTKWCRGRLKHFALELEPNMFAEAFCWIHLRTFAHSIARRRSSLRSESD